MTRICVLSMTWLLCALNCAAPIKQFYPGTFFPEDRTYQNKAIGFSLTYSGNWEIFTNPNQMKENKRYAKTLHESGAELLFIGYTVEETQGTRCIVTNLNEPCREYAEEMQRINKNQTDTDYGLSGFSCDSITMVKWEYVKDEFKFVEFFFTVGTYDLRVAFWTKPRLFGKFFPVYEEIIGSISLMDR